MFGFSLFSVFSWIFSKYEKSYGPYFRYAFLKNTKIPKIPKKKFFKSRFLDISDTLLSARHYGIVVSTVYYKLVNPCQSPMSIGSLLKLPKSSVSYAITVYTTYIGIYFNWISHKKSYYNLIKKKFNLNRLDFMDHNSSRLQLSLKKINKKNTNICSLTINKRVRIKIS